MKREGWGAEAEAEGKVEVFYVAPEGGPNFYQVHGY